MKIKKELRNGEGGRGLPTAHCSPTFVCADGMLIDKRPRLCRVYPDDGRLLSVDVTNGNLIPGRPVIIAVPACNMTPEEAVRLAKAVITAAEIGHEWLTPNGSDQRTAKMTL